MAIAAEDWDTVELRSCGNNAIWKIWNLFPRDCLHLQDNTRVWWNFLKNSLWIGEGGKDIFQSVFQDSLFFDQINHLGETDRRNTGVVSVDDCFVDTLRSRTSQP